MRNRAAFCIQFQVPDELQSVLHRERIELIDPEPADCDGKTFRLQARSVTDRTFPLSHVLLQAFPDGIAFRFRLTPLHVCKNPFKRFDHVVAFAAHVVAEVDGFIAAAVEKEFADMFGKFSKGNRRHIRHVHMSGNALQKMVVEHDQMTRSAPPSRNRTLADRKGFVDR